jgi:microcystin-dependent protein
MRNRKCYTGKVKSTDYQNIGKIDAFMRTTAPEGYLKCDGSTYNIADYPLLCDVFASDFGSVNYFGGDGTTTFAVPDLRGEFLRGTGTTSYSDGGNGAAVGTHQGATTIPYFYTTASGNNPRLEFSCKNGETEWPSSTDGPVGNRPTSASIYNSSTFAVSGANPAKFKVKPTNTSVLYCIRAY